LSSIADFGIVTNTFVATIGGRHWRHFVVARHSNSPSNKDGPPKRTVCFYFFLPDPNVGCQPAVAPFWLGAAAIVLTFSFFGFLDSLLPLAMSPSLG
jgi:hypothetical protein